MYWLKPHLDPRSARSRNSNFSGQNGTFPRSPVGPGVVDNRTDSTQMAQIWVRIHWPPLTDFLYISSPTHSLHFSGTPDPPALHFPLKFFLRNPSFLPCMCEDWIEKPDFLLWECNWELGWLDLKLVELRVAGETTDLGVLSSIEVDDTSIHLFERDSWSMFWNPLRFVSSWSCMCCLEKKSSWEGSCMLGIAWFYI